MAIFHYTIVYRVVLCSIWILLSHVIAYNSQGHKLNHCPFLLGRSGWTMVSLRRRKNMGLCSGKIIWHIVTFGTWWNAFWSCPWGLLNTPNNRINNMRNFFYGFTQHGHDMWCSQPVHGIGILKKGRSEFLSSFRLLLRKSICTVADIRTAEVGGIYFIDFILFFNCV